jgi:signal transduction histidine kinase
MKLRLQARYSLIVVAMLTAFAVLMAVAHLLGFNLMIQASTNATSGAVSDALYQQVRKRGEAEARLLADTLADNVFRLQVDRIQAVLDAAAMQQGILYVVVLDDKSRIISSIESGGTVKDSPLSEADIRRGLASGTVVLGSDGSTLHVAAPIRIGRRVIGCIKIGISLASTKTDIAAIGGVIDAVAQSGERYFFVLYIMIAAIIVAIGLGVGLLMVHNIVQPIRALGRYTRRIGTGDYDQLPPFEREDELGNLALELNHMAQNLKQVAQVSRLATLGEMTVGVAHELNQPLNTIRLAADNALLSRKQGGWDPDFTDSKLKLISGQAANMGEIIQRMCVVGGGIGAQTTIDSRESVRDAYSLLGSQYADEGINIAVDIPNMAVPVIGRRNELAQVMINLLSNAKDAICESASLGGVMARGTGGQIDVRMDSLDDEVVINVIDNGVGIPADLIDRVFDPFFTTKEATKGTGLGLSISLGIIDAMGGRLTAESNGAGTVFSVHLPKAGEALS